MVTGAGDNVPCRSFNSLRVSFPKRAHCSSCCERLDLSSTHAVIHCGISKIACRHRALASFTSRMIVIHLATDRPKGVAYGTGLAAPRRSIVITARKRRIALSNMSS